MLNYEVPASLLEALVPRGTVLDLWEDRALVSVVGFRFLRTRLLGIPIPFHRNFDEVNLRFYVRRELPDDEVRRGVVFIKELVPRRFIAWVARVAYNEPYDALPMRSETPDLPTEAPGTLRYTWRRRTSAGRTWESLQARAVGEASLPARSATSVVARVGGGGRGAPCRCREPVWTALRRGSGRRAKVRIRGRGVAGVRVPAQGPRRSGALSGKFIAGRRAPAENCSPGDHGSVELDIPRRPLSLMIALLRSVVAVLLGYIVFAVSAYAVFRLSGHAAHAVASVPFMLVSIASGVVFAIAGGYIAAWLAGRRPLAHAVAMAALLAVGATVSLVSTLGHGAIWSQVAALTLMAPGAVLGGWIRARSAVA